MATESLLPAAQLFERDDLEFRSVTTLLHILGSRDRITVENSYAPREHRPRLKLLTALASLLVRNHETLAIMLKRSGSGSTVYVGSEAEVTESDIRDDDPTASPTPHENVITLNPRFIDPSGLVELLISPEVDVGSDVFTFILKHWDMSFEFHVQAFSNLLNKSLLNPDDVQASIALDLYSVFQSSPKIYCHFKNSPCLLQMAALKPHFNTILTPSSADKVNIGVALMTNTNGEQLHPCLSSFLDQPPANPQRWLPEFHSFFTWFLGIVDAQLKLLGRLRTRELAPDALPAVLVDLTFNNLVVMRFFAWDSAFFACYIRVAFDIRNESVTAEDIPTFHPKGQEEKQPASNVDPMTSEDEAEEAGLDISTEFETGEEQQPKAVHPCIRELRLITSNVQHLQTLLERAPKAHFRFQVIQYARPTQSLKPWHQLIHELFPNEDREAQVLRALCDAPGEKFKYFRPGGPSLTFTGHAHCEAVLACLYSLSKRDEDVSWTKIPKSLLRAISSCYSVLAPSKRCCPVCADTISLLSAEADAADSRPILALSRHSITFPCAFPVGLPREIREKMLIRYREELRQSLTGLRTPEQQRSGLSAQLIPEMANTGVVAPAEE